MAWIATIAPEQAEGALARLYRQFANGDGSVDNILRVHALRPASLEAHCGLYVQAMHRAAALSRIEREMLAVEVSRVNGCVY